MIYIGISRGSKGTIGIIKENGDIDFVRVPIRYTKKGNYPRLNYRRLKEILEPYAATTINEVQKKMNAKALVEKPSPGKSKNISATFLVQNCIFEAQLAVLECLGISYETVEASQWHHDLFTGKLTKLSPKQASLEWGNEVFPELRQAKPTDRDGICIAYYIQNIKDYQKRK